MISFACEQNQQIEVVASSAISTPLGNFDIFLKISILMKFEVLGSITTFKNVE